MPAKGERGEAEADELAVLLLELEEPVGGVMLMKEGDRMEGGEAAAAGMDVLTSSMCTPMTEGAALPAAVAAALSPAAAAASAAASCCTCWLVVSLTI